MIGFLIAAGLIRHLTFTWGIGMSAPFRVGRALFWPALPIPGLFDACPPPLPPPPERSPCSCPLVSVSRLSMEGDSSPPFFSDLSESSGGLSWGLML